MEFAELSEYPRMGASERGVPHEVGTVFVSIKRARPRQRRWRLLEALTLLLFVVLVASSELLTWVEVNVSPLASVRVFGQTGRVLSGTVIEECLPEVMLDGTIDTLYLAAFRPRRHSRRDDHLALGHRSASDRRSGR